MPENVSQSMQTIFAEACRASITDVFSQALMAPWDASVQSGVIVPADALAITFRVSGVAEGELAFRLATPDAARLARMFLCAPEDDRSEWNDELREATEELMRQVAGRLATELKERMGEVALTFVSGAVPSWPVAAEVAFEVNDGSRPAARISVQLSAELLKSMCSSVGSVPTISGGLAANNSASTDRQVRGRNLELLMNVELGATLRFGQRRMLLREILDLSSGTVIELERQVQEPVELVLDGKLIARGEVVIVDGNYGLRITEVASDRERATMLL